MNDRNGPLKLLSSPIEVIRIPALPALFLRAQVVEKIGKFDETLGPGAGTPWGAGEDTDYYLRIFRAGFKLYQSSDIFVVHTSAHSYIEKKSSIVLIDMERVSLAFGRNITFQFGISSMKWRGLLLGLH